MTGTLFLQRKQSKTGAYSHRSVQSKAVIVSSISHYFAPSRFLWHYFFKLYFCFLQVAITADFTCGTAETSIQKRQIIIKATIQILLGSQLAIVNCYWSNERTGCWFSAIEREKNVFVARMEKRTTSTRPRQNFSLFSSVQKIE